MGSRIDPALGVDAELRRIAAAQAAEAAAAFGTTHEDHAGGVHRARKAIKRLRAVLALAPPQARRAAASADRHYRDIARALAGPRQAAARVEALDRLIGRHPRAAEKAKLRRLRDDFAERARKLSAAPSVARAAEAARGECLAGTARLPDCFHGSSPATLSRAFRNGLDHWKASLKAARRRGDAEDFHDLRKAVKAHLARLALLGAMLPAAAPRHRDRLDELGERLGELNDVNDLRQALRTGAIELPAGFDARRLKRLLRREARCLSRRCLVRAGKQLRRQSRTRLGKGAGRRIEAGGALAAA